ncbi:alpha-amylase family glycosyl hydrolase [Paraflavisolibacter sp. H34]|uniref:alpha-amylase family glycosyl hydrolase n=1 Tax=Huijunlia imazamoxiresistens TaxID=3127457 RepID=UPI00301894E9
MSNYSGETAWIKSTNVYEVNLRQYTKEGTFAAFGKELPRLKDMGVKTLWFMPITPIAQKHKKGSLGSYYAASDYTSINPEFGTLDDWRRLVDEAHEMGFKVIIDWVANHTGWDHIWTVTHPEYYERDPHTGDFLRASGMDDIIELDFNHPGLRRAMIDAMKFWVTETGIDGFRCDLAFWVQLDFWVEAKKELDPVKQLFWLGELDPLEHPAYMQVFDAAYTWTWMQKAQEFYHHHLPIHVLYDVLYRYQHVPGLKAWFTANHDENSWNGTEFEKYGHAAPLLAVFSCTWPGVPLIYSGQELPNRKRLQFFEKDTIEWSGRNELHDFYKTLLTLHATHPALMADEWEAHVHRLHCSDEKRALVYVRKNGHRQVLVLLNFSGGPLHLAIDDRRVTGVFRDVFSGEEKDLSQSKAFELEGWGYRVLEK